MIHPGADGAAVEQAPPPRLVRRDRLRLAAVRSVALTCALVGAAATPPVPRVAHADGAPVYLPLAVRQAAPPPIPPDRARVFGMQISEVRFRDPAIIAAIREAGATYWRTFLFWDEVEPIRTSPPRYDWALYDPLFQAADQLGLTVIAEIQGNPAWAADYPGGPPHDLDTLARFMAAAVERYDGDGVDDAPGRPVVRFWELYNEPDNTDGTLAREGRGWGYWGHAPAAYAQMLKRVYPVVKLANPRARVVFGGIAHDAFVGEGGPFAPAFLDDVLKAGAGPFFDVMNFHYYPLFATRWAAHGPGIVGKTVAIRRTLEAHGLDKPIMVTEAGMWSAANPPYPAATPADQMRYVPELYTQSLAAGLETVVWFQYDDVSGFDDPARGLVDRNLTPRRRAPPSGSPRPSWPARWRNRRREMPGPPARCTGSAGPASGSPWPGPTTAAWRGWRCARRRWSGSRRSATDTPCATPPMAGPTASPRSRTAPIRCTCGCPGIEIR